MLTVKTDERWEGQDVGEIQREGDRARQERRKVCESGLDMQTLV